MGPVALGNSGRNRRRSHRFPGPQRRSHSHEHQDRPKADRQDHGFRNLRLPQPDTRHLQTGSGHGRVSKDRDAGISGSGIPHRQAGSAAGTGNGVGGSNRGRNHGNGYPGGQPIHQRRLNHAPDSGDAHQPADHLFERRRFRIDLYHAARNHSRRGAGGERRKMADSGRPGGWHQGLCGRRGDGFRQLRLTRFGVSAIVRIHSGVHREHTDEPGGVRRHRPDQLHHEVGHESVSCRHL